MVAYPGVGSRFGPYEITGVLGQGGMGVVLSAVHEKLGRKVALKVLSADLASRAEFRRRFEREASALARLYSPHIIDVYDYGETDGWLFIATQLVAGRDLRDVLAHDGPMPPRQALGVIAQVASALSDAHDAGIIHRDVKPSNVLLHVSTDEVFAYVCDFGISQSDDGERTRTSGLLGTYAYMAPERHEGAEATVASDIYSLGCLLYAALTGRSPYEGTDVQVAMQHLHGDVPTYDGPEPTAGVINGILHRSLAKSPDERYPTASAMRADLLTTQRAITDDGQAEAGEGATALTTRVHAPSVPSSAPGSAGTPSDPPRPKRRRRVLMALVAVGAVAVVGAAILLGPQFRSRQQADPVQCWDGSRVARQTECSQPQGPGGLRWMFPSLDRDFGSCFGNVEPTTRVARSQAPTDASIHTEFCPIDTRLTGIGYTVWRSHEAAKAHFTRVYGHHPTPFRVGGSVGGRRWTASGANSKGYYKVAWLLRDQPFSSVVWATRESDVRRFCMAMTVRSLQTFKPVNVNCNVTP